MSLFTGLAEKILKDLDAAEDRIEFMEKLIIDMLMNNEKYAAGIVDKFTQNVLKDKDNGNR